MHKLSYYVILVLFCCSLILVHCTESFSWDIKCHRVIISQKKTAMVVLFRLQTAWFVVFLVKFGFYYIWLLCKERTFVHHSPKSYILIVPCCFSLLLIRAWNRLMVRNYTNRLVTEEEQRSFLKDWVWLLLMNWR